MTYLHYWVGLEHCLKVNLLSKTLFKSESQNHDGQCFSEEVRQLSGIRDAAPPTARAAGSSNKKKKEASTNTELIWTISQYYNYKFLFLRVDMYTDCGFKWAFYFYTDSEYLQQKCNL